MKPLLCLLTLSALAATNSPAALVAYWPLNTNASDATGHGHDGTVVSTVNFGQPGANANTGTSAEFTGTGHIDVPWAAALNPGTQAPNGSGSFSLTLWAFPTTVGGVHRSPFTNREDNGASVNGPIIYVEPAGLWTYWAGNNGPSGAWNPINATAASANVWTHVSITYDSATTTRKIFLNGTEAASQIIGVSANLLRNLHIGGGADDGNSFTWAGRIDDVGYWDNALSQADIQRVMAGGVPEPTLTALLGFSGAFLMRRRRR